MLRPLLLLALLALGACQPPAPTSAPPTYHEERRCDGTQARVRAPDGEWSVIREGFACADITPGQWACCDGPDGLACRPQAVCDGTAPPPAQWTQPPVVPGPQTVADFTQYMAERVHAHLFYKTDQPEMRLAASFLEATHVQSADHFLEDTATTLPFPGPNGAVASIYLPFVAGIERGPWDRDEQVGVLVHEPEHVLEYARDGVMVVAYRYIISPRWLVEYEIEAYLGQRAYLHWRGARDLPLDAWGALLAQYGVGPAWVLYARALMAAGAVAIDQDADAPQAWREFAHPWLDAHAPELRRVPLPPPN